MPVRSSLHAFTLRVLVVIGLVALALFLWRMSTIAGSWSRWRSSACSREAASGSLLVYIVVQQVEANLVLPLVERKVLELPPALVIFAVLALRLAFGTLGWIFAAPLTVLLVVAVGRLYVRETLSTPARLPGEQPREEA